MLTCTAYLLLDRHRPYYRHMGELASRIKTFKNYTEVANNSLTIPDYLSNRFEDTKTDFA